MQSYSVQSLDGNDTRTHPETDIPPTAQTLYVLVPPSPFFAAHWSLFLPGLPPHISSQRTSTSTITGSSITGSRHEESNIGTRIHVAGDRLHGFGLEIVRQYNINHDSSLARSSSGSSSRRFPIGVVREEYLRQDSSSLEYTKNGADTSAAATAEIVKDDEEGGGYVDNEPTSLFEQVCVNVEAPGPSLNSVLDDSGQGCKGLGVGRRLRREVKDCQWWISRVVESLCQEGILAPLPATRSESTVKSPVDTLQSIPKH